MPEKTAEGSSTGIISLPEYRPLCSCENITKGEICYAIDEGNTSLGAIGKSTSAGTGCGGCTPLVT